MLTGSKNVHLTANIKKLNLVFEFQGIKFCETNELYNILTKKVLPNDIAVRFPPMNDIGTERFHEFVTQQLHGDKSIWDTLKGQNYQHLLTINSQTTVVVNKQLYKLKEWFGEKIDLSKTEKSNSAPQT